jgi:hypothetical protein
MSFWELTKEFISKTSLNACFCHAGLSGIFLQEGFPTSGNDIQRGLTYDHISNRKLNRDTDNTVRREEPCGRDRRASKSKFKQPDLLKLFLFISSKYIVTAAETAGYNIYKG